MGHSRIFETLPEFDGYMMSNDARLHANIPGGSTTLGEYLGMTSDELVIYKNFGKKWRSGDPANPGVYERHLNPDTKNKVTTANVRSLMKEFGKFFRPILVRMSGSPNITNEDRIALNIAEPVTSHTHPTAKIEQRCFASMTMLGGGMAKILCHPTIDIARASKPVGADGLIIAYRIDTPTLVSESAPNETASKLKRPEITGPDDKTIKISQTKASFIMELGADNAGCILQFYTRWINSKHPDLNGPWTGPYSEIIS
jgi:hypothetical protein